MGDAEPALLDSDALQFVHRVDVNIVEDRTDAPGANTVTNIMCGVGTLGVHLANLPDLLLERHAREEVCNLVVG